MAVPKRRTSRSNTRHRRAQWKATAPDLVPVTIDGKLVRKHACIDGPEIDSHIIDWDKFLPRFGLFKDQERASVEAHGLG